MTRPSYRPTTPGRLLALLHQRGPITRAEATAHMDTARSAVGEAVGELARLGLVHVGAAASSPQRMSAGRGRTSPVLELAPLGLVAAAVHLHPSGADLGLIGLGGTGGPPERLRIPWKSDDLTRSLKQLSRWIADAIERSERQCVGVGVGVAGVVSADGRTVISALYLGWSDVPIADVLESFLPAGLKVSVHNDAVLTALAEHRRGAAWGSHTVLTLSCEHIGIGGAMISSNGSAVGFRRSVEAGHLTLDHFGPPCPCGQRGCLELYCDGRALARAAGCEHIDDPIQSQAIIARARQGALSAKKAVSDVANRLGTALAGLVNVLSPDRVVLTGLLGDYLALAGADLRAHLQTSIIARLHKTTLTAATVDHPVVIGAAEDVFNPLLADPVHFMNDFAPRSPGPRTAQLDPGIGSRVHHAPGPHPGI